MSSPTDRIIILESDVEFLKQENQKLNNALNNALVFIDTLRVMYEMKHPVTEELNMTDICRTSTIIDEQLFEDNKQKKMKKMNETYDDLDLLSDNDEEIYETPIQSSLPTNLSISPIEEVIIEAPLPTNLSLSISPIEEVIIEAPLPTNLSMSPMSENIEEIKKVINYTKMKVTELKKICKTRNFKGYTKLKKNQLIDLLSE